MSQSIASCDIHLIAMLCLAALRTTQLCASLNSRLYNTLCSYSTSNHTFLSTFCMHIWPYSPRARVKESPADGGVFASHAGPRPGNAIAQLALAVPGGSSQGHSLLARRERAARTAGPVARWQRDARCGGCMAGPTGCDSLAGRLRRRRGPGARPCPQSPGRDGSSWARLRTTAWRR